MDSFYTPHQPKEFARNSWDRLKKDHRLALVENLKVSCIETALEGAITKLWGGHALIYSVFSPPVASARSGLDRFDPIDPGQ